MAQGPVKTAIDRLLAAATEALAREETKNLILAIWAGILNWPFLPGKANWSESEGAYIDYADTLSLEGCHTWGYDCQATLQAHPELGP